MAIKDLSVLQTLFYNYSLPFENNELDYTLRLLAHITEWSLVQVVAC